MPILVVDDEVAIADLLVESFGDEGLNSICRYSGDSAIQYIKESKPSLILSDVNMPEGDGLKILDFILDNNLSIPVIFMTGYSKLTDQELIERGATHVFTKPMDFEDTVKQIKKIIKS